MPFRVIPSIDVVRHQPEIMAAEAHHGAGRVVAALRQSAEALRAALAGGTAVDLADTPQATRWMVSDALRALGTQVTGSLRPVLNATGVVVHTNLGRAPLATAAIDRMAAVACDYSNLEYDMAAGSRGSRSVHAEALLTTLTGAEAAIVVNNNAAATLLIMAALAGGREAVVSRGELVEIGGGFRVPDVIAQSGAVLREVGTTNRTRISDYTAAIGTRTALVLRVHPSNFRIEGFTERPALPALVAAAHQCGVPVVEDLGSGCLVPLGDEPCVPDSIAAGVDIVCFSGDKLLGGPQAGIILGRAALLQPLRTHPLMRALRVDKLRYAALEATLIEYVAGRAGHTVPVQRMLHATAEQIADRARTLSAALLAQSWDVQLVSGASVVGGGSAPGMSLATVLLSVAWGELSADALAARLRALDPPIVARIEHDRVVLDLRTIAPADDDRLAILLNRATRG